MGRTRIVLFRSGSPETASRAGRLEEMMDGLRKEEAVVPELNETPGLRRWAVLREVDL